MKQLKPGKPLGFFGSTPGIIDMLIVVLLCVASFIFYDQFYDMSVTSKQSSDLLDLIFSGNMLNFYTYVNMSAAYNIVLYLALAIWELPIYIINHIFALSNYDIVLEFWARFLSITLFCVCSYQMTKLSEMLMSDKVKAKWAGYYFISSPLIAYCVIIRNQLDIIPVLLIIFSIKKYVKKKYISFCLLMAFASCFKLMPFFIVIPLLCLAEKRIGKLIQYILLSFSLYAVTNITLLLADPGYGLTQSNVMGDEAFSQYIFKVVLPGGVSNTSVFLLIYFLICVIAYIMKPTEKDFILFAVMLCFSSLSAFFLFIKWHPQWIVLLLPFITLLVFSLIDFEFGVILDIIFTLGFLWTSILLHLTSRVFTNSIFYVISAGQYAPIYNFNPIYFFFDEHGYTTIIPSTIFSAGIISLLLIAFLNNRNRSPDINSSFDNKYKVARGWFYARSSLILIYIVPPLISYMSHPLH